VIILTALSAASISRGGLSRARSRGTDPATAWYSARFRFYGAKEYLAEVFPELSGDNFIRVISCTVSFRDEWRAGRDGIVKLVKDSYSQHWKIPKSDDLVFAWLKDLGWTPKMSAPGLLAKQIYRRLGGLSHILTNVQLLGLLERMNGGTVSGSGAPVEKNTITDEREIPVGK
jgi:hypothetical protein